MNIYITLHLFSSLICLGAVIGEEIENKSETKVSGWFGILLTCLLFGPILLGSLITYKK